MDKSFLIEQIKNYVSIKDVFDKYVGTSPDRHGRYKCPFNNSEDRKNFSIRNNKCWHCFSCGTSGDQITLVQKLFNLQFQDALLKIAEDFGLATENDEKISIRMRIESQRRLIQREKDKRYAKYINEKKCELYGYISGLYKKTLDVISNTNPKDMRDKYYPYTAKCEINIGARHRLRHLERYLDILSEIPTDDDIECIDFRDKDALHKRAEDLVKEYIKGELKL